MIYFQFKYNLNVDKLTGTFYTYSKNSLMTYTLIY